MLILLKGTHANLSLEFKSQILETPGVFFRFSVAT